MTVNLGKFEGWKPREERVNLTPLSSKKTCPLLKAPCLKEKCAWWSEDDKCCNLALISSLPTQEV